MSRLNRVNRILIFLVGLALLALAFFYKDAQTLFAFIALVCALVGLIFPAIATFYQKPWFHRPLVTVVLSIAFLALALIVGYSALQPRPPNLSIRRIEGRDAAGLCGIRCTVTIGGAGVGSLARGQQLAVYAPQARLIEEGQYTEAPIGVIRVLDIQQGNALAQVLLVHEAAAADPSRRLAENQLVTALGTAEPNFLVPAFGDGYVSDQRIVYLRPGTPVNVGDELEVMAAQISSERIMDHIPSGTTLEVTSVGAQAVSVETKVISGTVKAGDIILIKPVTFKQFELTPDRRIVLHYCIHAAHHWLTYQQLAPTISPRILFPEGERRGDYGTTNTCRSAQVSQDVQPGDVIEFGIGISNAPPDPSLTGTTWYRVQCCSPDGKLIRIQ